MNDSYVGVISQRGLESLIPERGHVTEFLTRRIYRTRGGNAVCYWAVLSENQANQVCRQLSCGRNADALSALQSLAIDLGTILPPDLDNVFFDQL